MANIRQRGKFNFLRKKAMIFDFIWVWPHVVCNAIMS